MRDQYLPLIAPGTVLTASGTGAALDLGVGTNAAKNNLPVTDLLGGLGAYAPLDAVIEVSGVPAGATATMTLSLLQSDDNTTFVPVGSTATVTTNGPQRLPFNPTKRFVMLSAVIAGSSPTFGVDACVGTRAF